MHPVEYDEMSKFRDAYMAIVGGLLWLANMTRVDIAYSASQLARFMTNPGPSHFKAAIRVLVYLRDTADRALVMMRPGCGCARARAVIQLVSKELMRPYCAVAELQGVRFVVKFVLLFRPPRGESGCASSSA